VQVKKAFCPPQIVEKNPIVDYCKFIIFGYYSKMSVTLNGVRAVTPRLRQLTLTLRAVLEVYLFDIML
jgi:hypothetical protein